MGMHADSDTVILEHRLRATLANGRSYDNDYCYVIKVRGEQICQMREYMDTLGGFRQIFGEDAIKPVAAVAA